MNEDAIFSLRGEERLYDMLSLLPSYLGQLYLRGGHHGKGIECLHKSLEVRVMEIDGDLSEVSWAEHNIGEGYITMGEYDKAMGWLEKGAETWKEWAKLPSETPRRSWAPFQHITMASCLLYMDRSKEARAVLEPTYQEYLANVTEQWTNAA